MQIYCYNSDLLPCSDQHLVNLLRFSTKEIAEKLFIQNIPCVYNIVLENSAPGSGFCCATYDDNDHEWHVEIEISMCEHPEMIKVLAHEMIHAKQYITGQLISKTEKINNKLQSVHYWHGKRYAVKVDVEPWEKQAYDMEYRLMKSTLNKWDSIIDQQFVYQSDITPQQNFLLWYDLNCREREAYGDSTLSRSLAEKLFCEQYNLNTLSGNQQESEQ